jgi:hypothetical protein
VDMATPAHVLQTSCLVQHTKRVQPGVPQAGTMMCSCSVVSCKLDCWPRSGGGGNPPSDKPSSPRAMRNPQQCSEPMKAAESLKSQIMDSWAAVAPTALGGSDE